MFKVNIFSKAKYILSPLKIWGVVNNGVFDFPIIIRFTEYNPIITKTPDIKFEILTLTWRKAVTNPATAPPKKAHKVATHGFTPFIKWAANILAPKGYVPSTEMSGKSNIYKWYRLPLPLDQIVMIALIY